MNRFFRWSLRALLLAGSIAALAQVSLDEGTIESREFDFDQPGGVLRYWGGVQLRYPGMLDLDCEHLEIRLQPGGNRLASITATTNVVMLIVQDRGTNAANPLARVGSTNRAYADEAVFNAVDNTVRLTSVPGGIQPRVEGDDITVHADELLYDRAKDKFSGKGRHRTVIRGGALPKDALSLPTSKPASAN